MSASTNGNRSEARPRMVMVVGNTVVGDSRVEKSARTAYRAGYDVVVLGLIHRSVAAFDTIDEIPVYRVPSPYAMHQWWRRGHYDTQFDPYGSAVEARRRLRLLHARARLSGRSRLILRLGSTTRRRIEDARLTIGRAAQGVRLAVSLLLAKLPVRGSWRRAYPYIADVELAFAEAIVDLEPDILHVHDRHILPGASTAAGILSAAGNATKWVYDAHEWLPGVAFQGPKAHRASWLAAESELIGGADAVITVSDELANMLRQRHSLTKTPWVVTNSPPMKSTLVTLEGRSSVRDDCGLGLDTDLLVYVGSIAEVRGVDTVVRALMGLPDVHLALIAPPDINRRQEIAKLSVELGVGDRVHILDYVPATSVSTYIASASVGVSPVEPIENYQYSLGTKIREYLHARLPIVGSSLQTLTRFLGETGVGAVHCPGDPDDCARVIMEVLANRAEHVASITDELLSEHSWERQETVLVQAWGDLLGGHQPPPRADAPRLHPRLMIGPAVEWTRSQNLLSAVCRQTDGSGEVVSRDALVGQRDRLAMKIDEYQRLVAFSDGLLLEDLRPLFGGLLGNSESLLRHLAGAKSVAVMFDPVVGVDVDDLLARVPDCWLLALDIGTRERIARQARRTREILNQVNVPVLSTSPLPMPDLQNVTWVPTVVDLVPREPGRDRPLRVLVAPGPRAGRDARVPEMVVGLASPRIETLAPSTDDDAQDLLPDADVFVDNMGHGSYTDLGAQAMGHGCVVISRIDEAAGSILGPSCPVINATPDSLTAAIADLAADRDQLARLSESSNAFATKVHDGTKSAHIVMEALGWSF